MNKRTPVPPAAAVALVLLLTGAPLGSCTGGNPVGAGPERITFRVERVGGQTGGEGSCLPSLRTSLDFTAEQARALLEGEHHTTLAHRPVREDIHESLEAEQARPVTVSVSLRGEPRTRDHCGLRIEQDVEVVMAFEDPPLDLVIEETASVFTSHFGVLHAELDPAVLELLGLPEAGPEQETLGLEMTFHPHGVEGRHATGGGYQCGEAVFPAGVHCSEWGDLEVSAHTEMDGFRPVDAVEAVQALSGTEVRWDDGTATRLSFAVEGDPLWACHTQWSGERACPYHTRVPLNVRLTSDDGRLDLLVPAQAEIEIATEESVGGGCGDHADAGWDGRLTLIARAVLPADAGFGGMLSEALVNAKVAAATVELVLHANVPGAADESRLTVGSLTGTQGMAPINAVEQDFACFGVATPLAIAGSGAFLPTADLTQQAGPEQP